MHRTTSSNPDLRLLPMSYVSWEKSISPIRMDFSFAQGLHSTMSDSCLVSSGTHEDRLENDIGLTHPIVYCFVGGQEVK